MKTEMKLLVSSAIVALALSIPQKTQAMEAQVMSEKVNGSRLKVNLYNNDQHRINEEVNVNRESAAMEVEGNYLWGYMTWIAAGALEVSYVCVKALPYMITLTKDAVPPQTLTETLLSPIFGTPERIERRDYVISTLTQAQHLSEGFIDFSANLKGSPTK